MTNMAYRARVAIVAIVVIIVCVGGYRVWTSWRARVAIEAAAEASASATARVGDDIDVCGVISAKLVEEYTGQQLDVFSMYTKHDFQCMAWFTSGDPFEYIEFRYDDQILRVLKSNRFMSTEELSAQEGVEPLVLEGVEGRGFTIRSDMGAPAVFWEYPNGYYASLRPYLGEYDRQERLDANLDILVRLFEQMVTELPGTATFPEVEVTSYPEQV